MPPPSSSLDLARHLADLGWHVFPPAPTGERPLANCRAVAPATGFPAPRTSRVSASSAGPVAYLDTFLDRGAEELAHLRDRRKRALVALAYKAGGCLASSGRSEQEVPARLVTAGLATALVSADAERIARRSLANGIARPLTPPSPRTITPHGRTA